MVRTQIQIDESHHRRLREEAFQRGISVSAVLRELADERYEPQRPRARDRAAARAIIGMLNDEADDVAENHAAYLTREGA